MKNDKTSTSVPGHGQYPAIGEKQKLGNRDATAASATAGLVGALAVGAHRRQAQCGSNNVWWTTKQTRKYHRTVSRCSFNCHFIRARRSYKFIAAHLGPWANAINNRQQSSSIIEIQELDLKNSEIPNLRSVTKSDIVGLLEICASKIVL